MGCEPLDRQMVMRVLLIDDEAENGSGGFEAATSTRATPYLNAAAAYSYKTIMTYENIFLALLICS
jgi:hypothetical protein